MIDQADLHKYSFKGLLQETTHLLIVEKLMNWQTFTSSKEEFLCKLCEFVLIERNDMQVVERHLCYYHYYLIKAELVIPPILYLFKFNRSVKRIPFQYLSLLSEENGEKLGITGLLKNHADFTRKHCHTKEVMRGWFHKIQEDGFIDCKDFFEKVSKPQPNSVNQPTKKKKAETSARYSFGWVAKYFLFDQHKEFLERVEINSNTYIIFKYVHEFFPNYIQYHQSYHQIIIPNNNNNAIHHKTSNNEDCSTIPAIDEKIVNCAEENDITELTSLFLKSLHDKKLTPKSFFFKYLKDAFSYLNNTDKRAQRWSPEVLCYAQDLLTSMGYNLYDAIGRGHVNGNPEKFDTSADYCNLILPSPSTLDYHFHHPNIGYGDTSLDKSDFKYLRKIIGINANTFGVLHVDAMDLSPNLSINRKSGVLVGALAGPISIAESHIITEDTIQNNFLAEKVIQTLYTDIEGRLRIPVSDAGGANWKYFTQSSEHPHHFCYSHLCKNIRNAVNTKPKLYPVNYLRKYIMQDISRLSTVPLSSSEGKCHLLKLSFHKYSDSVINLTFKIGEADEITINWGKKKTTFVNGSSSSIFYTVDDNLRNLSLSFLCTNPINETITNLTISNRSTENIFFISIEESILQRFELKTLDEIYQTDPIYWSKIIKRSSFINFDDQSEDVLRQVCSSLLVDELFKLNQKSDNRYQGLYLYLKMIHDIFHVYDDIETLTKKSKYSLRQVESVLTLALDYLNKWDSIFSDINLSNKNNNFTIFGTYTKSTIAHNLKTITKLISLLPETVTPYLHVFGTRSLEGFFGEQRVYSKRTTVMEYIMRYSSLKFQYFKKECVQLPYATGVKRKYTNEQHTDKTINTETFITYLHDIKKRIEIEHKPFSNEDFARAQTLQLLCVKYRVNSIRQSFHQLRYNSADDEIIFEPQLQSYHSQTLAQFEVSPEVPLDSVEISTQMMQGVESRFMMCHNSFIHKETQLPTFLASNPIELEIFGLPSFEIPLKLTILNTPKKSGNPYIELPMSFKLYPNTPTNSHRLICSINSTTSTTNYTKKIILTIGNQVHHSPPFFFYKRNTHALCKVGDQTAIQSSQRLSTFCWKPFKNQLITYSRKYSLIPKKV